MGKGGLQQRLSSLRFSADTAGAHPLPHGACTASQSIMHGSCHPPLTALLDPAAGLSRLLLAHVQAPLLSDTTGAFAAEGEASAGRSFTPSGCLSDASGALLSEKRGAWRGRVLLHTQLCAQPWVRGLPFAIRHFTSPRSLR